MEYDQVQRYSAVYQLQDKYSALQDRTIDEFLQLQSYVIYGFDPKKCGRRELLYAGMSKMPFEGIPTTLTYMRNYSKSGDGD